MAIRLYPNTEKHEVLEKLAGASEGSWQKFLDYKEETNKKENELIAEGAFGMELDEFQFERFTNIPDDLRKCSDLSLFGWGRMSWQPKKHMNNGKNSPCGETTDAVEVLEILIQNRVDLNGVHHTELEGVSWG